MTVKAFKAFVCSGLIIAFTMAAPNGALSQLPLERSNQAKLVNSLQFTGHVVDQASLLGLSERRRLTMQLGRFQQITKHQMAVVTVKTLDGMAVETFTRQLANRWGVGRKGFNDGIVILVARAERKTHIAVGLGLEGRLPNGFCQDVIDRQMVPDFRSGQFGRGFEAGVSAIINRLAQAPR